jgi:ABC-type antimicrobial peptide transport system permease subunit
VINNLTYRVLEAAAAAGIIPRLTFQKDVSVVTAIKSQRKIVCLQCVAPVVLVVPIQEQADIGEVELNDQLKLNYCGLKNINNRMNINEYQDLNVQEGMDFAIITFLRKVFVLCVQVAVEEGKRSVKFILINHCVASVLVQLLKLVLIPIVVLVVLGWIVVGTPIN